MEGFGPWFLRCVACTVKASEVSADLQTAPQFSDTAIGVGFYFFGCLVLAARRVHGFGRVRGLGAGVPDFPGWLAIGLTAVAPVDQLFQKAFLR